MSKTTYIATAADGTEHTRTTDRVYTHAVLIYRMHYSNDPAYWSELIATMETWNQPERLAETKAEAAKATGEPEWMLSGFCGRYDLAVKLAEKKRQQYPTATVEIVEAVAKQKAAA